MLKPAWDPAVDLEWGDGEYRFRLGFGELVALEAKMDAGYLVMHQALISGLCRAELVREVIRLGLEGGGAKPETVRRLIHRYVEKRPVEESRPTAIVVMNHAINPPKDAAGGKAEGGGDETDETTTDSPSP